MGPSPAQSDAAGGDEANKITHEDTFVGIDVAKRHLDVHILPEGKHWRVDYTPKGLADLVSKLGLFDPVLIVMEASGGYERACADALAGAEFAVAVVNPRQTRRFGQKAEVYPERRRRAGSTGKLAKTDQIDAEMIALHGQCIKPVHHHKPDPAHAMLTAFVARRTQIVAMAIMEKQRADPSLIHPSLMAGLKQHLRLLEKQCLALQVKIEAIIAAHPLWSRIAAALQEVKGVGPQTATTLITHMPELGTFNRREVAALAGLAPINRDSGSSRGRRYTQGGRNQIKTALYLAALSAARHHPTLKIFYKNFRDAGKAPKSALIAVARKLLITLNSIAKTTIQCA